MNKIDAFLKAEICTAQLPWGQCKAMLKWVEDAETGKPRFSGYYCAITGLSVFDWLYVAQHLAGFRVGYPMHSNCYAMVTDLVNAEPSAVEFVEADLLYALAGWVEFRLSRAKQAYLVELKHSAKEVRQLLHEQLAPVAGRYFNQHGQVKGGS